MAYIILKWVHILSATILFGTGIGSAFYVFAANREKNLAGIYFATTHVVIADWLFIAPAVVIQFVTGVWLLYLTGYSLSDGWVRWGVALYFFVICNSMQFRFTVPPKSGAPRRLISLPPRSSVVGRCTAWTGMRSVRQTVTSCRQWPSVRWCTRRAFST